MYGDGNMNQILEKRGIRNGLGIARLDAACNAGFRKLEELKAAGKDGSPEYMQALYELRALTRSRWPA